MSSKAKKLLSSRIIVTISTALIVFQIVYLGWVFYDIQIRYSNAVFLAERHAHTILGKEGYEYIFEPATQILIDKIKTNREEIIFHIFLKDYLPFQTRPECPFRDKESCHWMDIHLFYGHDPTPVLRKIIPYASIIALLSAFATQAITTKRTT